MKIQLDFDNKIIKLESTVKVEKLLDMLPLLLKDYKDWSIEAGTVIWYTQYPVVTYPTFPTITPTWCTNNNTTPVNGTYTVEL